MKTITKTCLTCNKEFEASLKEHNRGNAKFCSRKCSGENKQGRRVTTKNNVLCALCGKHFHMSESKQINSKSGLYFCCRDHKDKAQRIGGIEAIMPDHYGEGVSSYRALAFRIYQHKCNICGYEKYPQVLQVHHIDCDRTNVSEDNLEILCPTCHTEKHFINGTGYWANKI